MFLKKANQCCAGGKKKHLQMKIPSVFSVKPIFVVLPKKKKRNGGVLKNTTGNTLKIYPL